MAIREHGDRRDIELAARADDAERDFAAIGDEKTLDHQENGLNTKDTITRRKDHKTLSLAVLVDFVFERTGDQDGVAFSRNALRPS